MCPTIDPLRHIYNDFELNRGDVIYKVIKAAKAGFFTQTEVFYLKHLIRIENENAQRTNRPTY